MAFKLLQDAERTWNRVRGFEEVKNVLNGFAYKDGVMIHVAKHQEAAAS